MLTLESTRKLDSPLSRYTGGRGLLHLPAPPETARAPVQVMRTPQQRLRHSARGGAAYVAPQCCAGRAGSRPVWPRGGLAAMLAAAALLASPGGRAAAHALAPHSAAAAADAAVWPPVTPAGQGWCRDYADAAELRDAAAGRSGAAGSRLYPTDPHEPIRIAPTAEGHARDSRPSPSARSWTGHIASAVAADAEVSRSFHTRPPAWRAAAATTETVARPSEGGTARAAQRRLHASPRESEEVTEVRTAEELRAAVADGRAHIVVQRHLGFTSLEPTRRLRADWALGFAPTTVQSILVCHRPVHVRRKLVAAEPENRPQR